MVLLPYIGIPLCIEAKESVYTMSGGLQFEREQQYERSVRHEKNALTLMPLPVQIRAEWYDLMPKVLRMIEDTPDKRFDKKYLVRKEAVDSFIQQWDRRLMTREGNGEYVWIHLGGLEAFETIPNFSRAIEAKIKGLDAEMREKGGLKGIIDLWRTGIEELNNLNDMEVLDARKKILYSVESLMSTVTLSGCWAHAFERARDNILKIRPVVENWINTQGRQWDLDKPFGGKIEDTVTERMN